MTPLLVLVFGLAPPAAISTDLVYACITKIFGSIAYWRSAHADIRLACTLASASLPGSALGTWTMLHLSHGPGSDHKVRITIGLALMLVAGALLFQPSRVLKSVPRPPLIGSLTYAMVIGFLVGLTSVGSGSLMLPFLMLAHRLKPIRALATDIVHATILLGLGAITHASLGMVQWNLVLLLIAGSVPGILVGAKLAPVLPEQLLRITLNAVVLVSGWKLIF